MLNACSEGLGTIFAKRDNWRKTQAQDKPDSVRLPDGRLAAISLAPMLPSGSSALPVQHDSDGLSIAEPI